MADTRALVLFFLSFVAATSAQGGGAAGGGSYQQYYQKYMKAYAGRGNASGGAGGYQQYYQKYMKQYAGHGNASGGAGGYQQYYQKYMKGSAGGGAAAGGGAGGYQQYYQKYMKGSAGGGGAAGGFQQYYQQYMQQSAGRAAPSSKPVESISPAVMPVEFISPAVMAQARNCTNEVCLHAWREATSDKVKDFVPKEYQSMALQNIEKEYEKNLARLRAAKASTMPPTATPAQAPTPAPAPPPPMSKSAPVDFAAIGALISPVVMAQARKCKTEVCLRAWRDAHEDKIKAYVPKDYQDFPLASIEKEYKNNFARIKQMEASTPTTSPVATDAPPASTSQQAVAAILAAKSRNHSSIGILAIFSLGLIIGAIFLYTYTRNARLENTEHSMEIDLLKHPAMLVA